MEWQQIIGFYHVARLGSFTKAAKATFRTQSAVSQQVKNLEAELECQLLQRTGKQKIRLTFAGERFFKFAASVLEKYRSLIEEIDDIKGLQAGRLKMAAPFTTLYHLVPSVLKRYTDKFKNVELTILDRSQPEILDLVSSGDLDFGFVLESNVHPELITLRWKKVRTVLLAPVDHPLTKIERVTLKQIGDYPLILPPADAKYRSDIEEKFQRLGIDYHVIMESSNVELSSLYVEMGLGISFATAAENLPDLKIRKLAFIPMDHVFKPDHIAVVMRQDKNMASHKKAFINMLFA